MKSLLTVAICCVVVTPPIAGNDIVDFIEKWRGYQRQYDRRFDRWDEYRNNRRGQARPRIEPRIEPQPTVTVNPTQVVGELHDLAREMQPYLTAIVNSVDSNRDESLEAYGEAAEKHLFSMIAAGRDHDRALYSQQHERFDENWQQLLYRFQNYKRTEKFEDYVNYVNEKDRRIHQLLHQEYRPGYDNSYIASLAAELDDNVEALVRKIEQNGPAWDERAVYFQARRVSRHADDFAEISRTRASHELLSQEFEQFDNSWHTLTERLRRYGPRDLNLHSEIAAVRNTDRQLHDVLFVEAPVVSDQRSIDAILRRTHFTAHELIEEMRHVMWREQIFGHQEVIGYLAKLRDEVGAFYELPVRQQTESRWKNVADSWLAFKSTESGLPVDRISPSVTALQESLDADMTFLSRRFDGPTDVEWRYNRATID